MNKKLCPLPWVSFAIKNNGDMRVCCHANTSIGKGILKTNKNTAFNVANDEIDQGRNSDLLNSVRLSMLNNEPHIACTRCDKEEAAGLRSRRQYEMDRASEFFSIDFAQAVTDEVGKIDLKKSPVRFMDLRVSNRCNLKCRMCGPSDSDSWYDDYAAVWDEAFIYEGDERINFVKKENGKWTADSDKYNWINKEFAWDEIKKNLERVIYIYIVGGEPLLVDGHLDILKECIEMDLAKNIILEYNTNLTFLSEEILRLWRSFKKVRVGISIDGIGGVNNYIRHPSNWKQIEQNLEMLLRNRQEHQMDVWFSFTYQAYNAFHLIEVLEWIKNNYVLNNDKKYSGISLKPHVLHKPDFYSVQIFTMNIKNEIANLYDDYIKKIEIELQDKHLIDNWRFKKFAVTTKQNLESFKNFMFAEDLSNHLDIFLRFTKDLDRMRQEDVAAVIPQIGKMING